MPQEQLPTSTTRETLGHCMVPCGVYSSFQSNDADFAKWWLYCIAKAGSVQCSRTNVVLELDCKHLATYSYIVLDVLHSQGYPHPGRLKATWKQTSAKQKNFTETKKLRDACSVPKGFWTEKPFGWKIFHLPGSFGTKLQVRAVHFHHLEPLLSHSDFSNDGEPKCLDPKNPCCVQALVGDNLSSSNPNSIGNTCIANVYKHLHIYMYNDIIALGVRKVQMLSLSEKNTSYNIIHLHYYLGDMLISGHMQYSVTQGPTQAI